MEKQDEEFILTMKQGIQIGRSLVQILLTLILTLTVFCYGSYVMTGRATDADFYIQLADRAQERDGFYDQIYQNADRILQSRGALSSLPQTVFEDVLTPEYTRRAVEEYIRATVDGTLDSFSLTELMESIRSRCMEYLAQHPEISVTEQEIDEYCAYLDDEMIEAMKLPFFAKVYPSVAAVLGTGRWMISALLIVVFAVCGVALLFLSDTGKRFRTAVMQKKAGESSTPGQAADGSAVLPQPDTGLEQRLLVAERKLRLFGGLRMIAVGLLGGAVMLLAVSIFLWALNSAEIFNFSTAEVLSYLDALKQSAAFSFLWVAAIVLVLGVLLAVFSERKVTRVRTAFRRRAAGFGWDLTQRSDLPETATVCAQAPLDSADVDKESSAQVALGAEDAADQVSPAQVLSDSEVPNKAFSEQASLDSQEFDAKSSADDGNGRPGV